MAKLINCILFTLSIICVPLIVVVHLAAAAAAGAEKKQNGRQIFNTSPFMFMKKPPAVVCHRTPCSSDSDCEKFRKWGCDDCNTDIKKCRYQVDEDTDMNGKEYPDVICFHKPCSSDDDCKQWRKYGCGKCNTNAQHCKYFDEDENENVDDLPEPESESVDDLPESEPEPEPEPEPVDERPKEDFWTCNSMPCKEPPFPFPDLQLYNCPDHDDCGDCDDNTGFCKYKFE